MLAHKSGQMKLAVVLVAAGESRRLPGDVPKTLRLHQGKPLVVWAVEKLLAHEAVAVIQPVVRTEDVARVAEYLKDFKVCLPPMAGGAQRQDSVRHGLEALRACGQKGESISHVLIHDAARPMVPADMLARLIDALDAHDAVIPVLPVVDTIKRLDGAAVVETLPRAQLGAVQTPQAFTFSTIYGLHQRMEGDALTDDAALCEAAGVPVHTVAGDARAKKITTPEDWAQLEAQMECYETRVGQGFDVHALVARGTENKPLMLGGVAVECSHYLDGHSDADVVLHAVVDAVLGALGKGDIGEHFPPSDAKWKGAASAQFVEHAAKLMREAGAELSFVDVTVLCEFPKITPYKAAMCAKIAALLGVDETRVSVKATTTEKLGFLGRCEGIAAMATATLKVKNHA